VYNRVESVPPRRKLAQNRFQLPRAQWQHLPVPLYLTLCGMPGNSDPAAVFRLNQIPTAKECPVSHRLVHIIPEIFKGFIYTHGAKIGTLLIWFNIFFSFRLQVINLFNTFAEQTNKTWEQYCK
jgi:hypothetical protein